MELRVRKAFINKYKNIIEKILKTLKLDTELKGLSLSATLQYQAVYLFAIAGILISTVFGSYYFYIGLTVVAVVMFSSVVITLAVLYLFRSKVTAEALGHLVLALLLAILTVANLFLGGFDNPNDSWFMVVPLIGAVLINRQTVWQYSSVILAIVVSFFIFKKLGFKFDNHLTSQQVDIISLSNRLAAVSTLAFLIIVYRYQRYATEKELTDSQENLYKLANIDPLTSLANRTYFAKRFSQSIISADKEQQSLTMLFVDLDAFKIVNDTYGHNVGDELLIEVARRFKIHFGDALVCRHGGDEFLLMLELGLEQNKIDELCLMLVSEIAKPFQLKNCTANIGCSIGIASYPEHGSSFVDVLRAADIAMYQAKSQGGEQSQVFTDRLSRKIEDTNKIAIDLRNAIDNELFSVQYQSKHSLSNQSVIGYEALLRWTNTDGKTIAPEVFVKIAEEFSLMSKLGDWTLRAVCKQLQKWNQDTGKRACVAINISANQIFKSDFIESLIVITEHYGVIPEQLELELTESIFVDSSFKILHKLQKLHDLGFKLIIDDYGTGYASIGYLKKFPVAGLKIDKTFIKEILESKQDRVIVQSTISLAHELGLKVIAEGVENIEQVELLEKLNCDIVQGYYYSKPLKASSIEVQNSMTASGVCFNTGGIGQSKHSAIARSNSTSEASIIPSWVTAFSRASSKGFFNIGVNPVSTEIALWNFSARNLFSIKPFS